MVRSGAKISILICRTSPGLEGVDLVRFEFDGPFIAGLFGDEARDCESARCRRCRRRNRLDDLLPAVNRCVERAGERTHLEILGAFEADFDSGRSFKGAGARVERDG